MMAGEGDQTEDPALEASEAESVFRYADLTFRTPPTKEHMTSSKNSPPHLSKTIQNSPIMA